MRQRKLLFYAFLGIFGLFVLVSQLLPDVQVEKAIGSGGFLFIFIAYITFFPLIIRQARPLLSNVIYPFHSRPPPVR